MRPTCGPGNAGGATPTIVNMCAVQPDLRADDAGAAGESASARGRD